MKEALHTPVFDRIYASIPDAAAELFREYIKHKDVETRVKLKIRIKILLDHISVDTVNPTADATRLQAAQMDQARLNFLPRAEPLPQPQLGFPPPPPQPGVLMQAPLQRIVTPTPAPAQPYPNLNQDQELTEAQRIEEATALPVEATQHIQF